MKKKNLKSLKLNKKSISSLQSSKITGGTLVVCTGTIISFMICVPDKPKKPTPPDETEYETCMSFICHDN